MLPPRLVRRLVLVPLVIVIAAGLAAGLDAGGALVIFPEGGNWTPLRWRRAIERLRRRGHMVTET
jgi:hypothetical protein